MLRYQNLFTCPTEVFWTEAIDSLLSLHRRIFYDIDSKRRYNKKVKPLKTKIVKREEEEVEISGVESNWRCGFWTIESCGLFLNYEVLWGIKSELDKVGSLINFIVLFWVVSSVARECLEAIFSHIQDKGEIDLVDQILYC